MSRFSPSEIALLNHRLEIWDAITEVLADDDDEAIATIAQTDPAHVHLATLQIMGLMGMGRSVEDITSIANQSPLHAAVLRDAVSGSTYIACIPDDEPQRRGAAIRAARSVTRKLRAAGFDCNDVSLV